MTQYTATPATLQATVEQARAGDRIVLLPGPYGPLVLDGVHGAPGAPITITGPRDAIFDGNRRYDDFREEANEIAARHERAMETTAPGAPTREKIPSLAPIAQNGQIRLINASHIRLEGFAMHGCWPTCIAIDSCQHVTLADLALQEGTFAIHATGIATRHLTVSRCTWIQDIERGRLWRYIGWDQIHGDHFKDDDHRGLDGDFLRCWGIAGNVVVEDCVIEHAFNAIHLFNSEKQDPDRRQNRNVRISGCRFSHIRDNAIEPEYGAWNWWIHGNDFHNVYKTLSFEMRDSGHFYVFGNTAWFDDIPSRSVAPELSLDERLNQLNIGGSIFKLPKKQVAGSGPHFVFNNSIALRSGYLKKRRLTGLVHFNNAIQFADPADHPNGAVDIVRPLLWQPGKPPGSDTNEQEHHFTLAWGELNIEMVNDAIDHEDYPAAIEQAGYPIGRGLAIDPGFRAAARGDLRLNTGSPLLGAAMPRDLPLIDGTTWTPQGVSDIGAWQGDVRVAPPDTYPGFDDADSPLV